MLSLIRNCEKVSFILPGYLRHEYSRRLQRISKGRDIYVGKEAYTEVGWMISVKGLWTRQLINRYKTVYVLGHWHRWIELFTMRKIAHESPYPVAAKLYGNIILIFIVWIFTLVGASFAFVFESCKLNRANLF